MRKSSIKALAVHAQAQVRIGFVLGIGATVALAAAGGLMFQHYRAVQAQKAAAVEMEALSASTDAVLKNLKSPIELRFYALLDPSSTPESLRAFADRVNQLLAEYERAGDGKIRVARFDELTDANAKAAAADGIHSFNREKGDACYLGIAAIRDGQRESIAELSPEWEQALESDLSRAIANVNAMVPAGATPANVPETDLQAARKGIDANPALASASLEEGTAILRDAAMAEFKAVVADMQNQSSEATAQLNQGAISQQDAAKELQQIRAEQTRKIQEITARLHDQLAALAASKAAGN